MVQHNNVQKSDRLSGKDSKGVLCSQMTILRHKFEFSSLSYGVDCL